MIYQKTALGQQEINLNARVLNFRQRQILIMIDGKRSLDELSKFFNNVDVPEILTDLEKQGYIHSAINNTNSAASSNNNIGLTIQQPAAPTAITSDSGEIALSENQVLIIKDIINTSCDEYLGMMGRPIKLKVEAAGNYAQLKACISQWHMAMRESKAGREPAGFLMEQVQQTLENKTVGSKSLAGQTAITQEQH